MKTHTLDTYTEEVLCLNGKKWKSDQIRQKLVEFGLKTGHCEECGLKPKWNGKKLIMHLDHINGNHRDNRLENLRIMCPNCHSQTDTYCGKNKGKVE